MRYCCKVRIWFTSHLNVQLPSADVIARGQNLGTGISLTGLRMGGDRRGVNSFLVIGNPPSSFLVFRPVQTYKLGTANCPATSTKEGH